jgi:hypothetical protein
MIAGAAVVPAVAVEEAAVSAGTIVFEIAAAGEKRAEDWPGRVLGTSHVARLAASVAAGLATRITTTGTAIWSNGSAAGRRERDQREHDKRAFHRFPPNDLASPAAVRRELRRAARSLDVVSAA